MVYIYLLTYVYAFLMVSYTFWSVARPSRMLSWPFGMAVHHPVERNRHICMYSKKIFVRGVVRGIDFEKSLLERLSPEGGQNWHKLPSHTSYNMPKSNKNTSLAHHSGRKQGFLSTSPPTMNGLSWPAFKLELELELELFFSGKQACNITTTATTKYIIYN